MIKQLRFSLKMLKYGHGVISNVLGVIVCTLLGLFLLIGNAISQGRSTSLLSGFLLCISGTFLVQIWMSLNSSGLLLSSPRHRVSLCAIPVIMESFLVLAGFTFVLAISLILRGFYPNEWLDMSRDLYLLAVMIFFLNLYFSFCYRYFIISAILFFISYYSFDLIGYVFLWRLLEKSSDSAFFTMPVTIAVCYGILFAGILLNGLFTYLLRKKPLDKWAQGAMLRKYL